MPAGESELSRPERDASAPSSRTTSTPGEPVASQPLLAPATTSTSPRPRCRPAWSRASGETSACSRSRTPPPAASPPPAGYQPLRGPAPEGHGRPTPAERERVEEGRPAAPGGRLASSRAPPQLLHSCSHGTPGAVSTRAPHHRPHPPPRVRPPPPQPRARPAASSRRRRRSPSRLARLRRAAAGERSWSGPPPTCGSSRRAVPWSELRRRRAGRHARRRDRRSAGSWRSALRLAEQALALPLGRASTVLVDGAATILDAPSSPTWARPAALLRRFAEKGPRPPGARPGHCRPREIRMPSRPRAPASPPPTTSRWWRRIRPRRPGARAACAVIGPTRMDRARVIRSWT